jgi:hypothetical protein
MHTPVWLPWNTIQELFYNPEGRHALVRTLPRDCSGQWPLSNDNLKLIICDNLNLTTL